MADAEKRGAPDFDQFGEQALMVAVGKRIERAGRWEMVDSAENLGGLFGT